MIKRQLMLSACVSFAGSGVAEAQGVSITGQVSAAENAARVPLWYNAPGQTSYGDRYDVTVVDFDALLQSRVNAVNYPSNFIFVFLYDPAESSYADGLTAFNNAASVFGIDAGGAALVPNQTTGPGEYQLFVGFGDSLPLGTYDITLFGLRLGWGPTPAEEVSALIGATGAAMRLVAVDAAGVARDLGQVSLATRDGVRRQVQGASVDTSAPSGGAPSLTNGLYTWAEVTSFRTTGNGGGLDEIGGGGVQIGADIAIGDNMVAGLSLGYSDISASDNGFSQEGTYTFAQPYLSYRSGAWHGNASLIYGIGSFDQTSLGGVGTADVTLAAVTFEGGYDFTLNDGFTLTPTIGLIHGREEFEVTGGTLAGASESMTFTQFSLGGRVSYESAQGTLFAGLHADYLDQSTTSLLARDILSDDGWTGRIEVGGEIDLRPGLSLSSSLELSGLGGDMRTVHGGLSVALRF